MKARHTRASPSTAPAVMWHDFNVFTLKDAEVCSAAIRDLAFGAPTVEQLAKEVVRYLYERLVDKKNRTKACALVRFFKTIPYHELPLDLQRVIDQKLACSPAPDMKCLTLLATAGDRPEWNARQHSIGHKTIPLPSREIIEQAPMISQLLKQLGMSPANLVRPDPAVILDLEKKTFNAFLIENAAGSPFVPAQEFVARHGVRSVLGFGGLISGEFFVVILFSKVPVSRTTADLFEGLVATIRSAALPLVHRSVFGP